MGTGTMKLAAGCAALFAAATCYAQGPGAERPRKLADSFATYKSHIRPLSTAATKACEVQLHGILKAIDEGQACAADSECTLVGEEPFGPSVPVRTSGAKALSSDMKQFKGSCNNESMRSFYNKELVHEPACVQNRCIVKTSLKR